MSDIKGAASVPLLLIAENEDWEGRALTSIFEANGFTVIKAASGRDAAELALARQPDGVIVGDRLPDLAGVELCRRLRAEPRFNPWTPLVLLTAGSIARDERVSAYQAGAWDVLTWPLDGEMLLLKMRTFLGARRQGRVLRADRLLDAMSGLYSIGNLLRRMDEINLDASTA